MIEGKRGCRRRLDVIESKGDGWRRFNVVESKGEILEMIHFSDEKVD